MMSKDPTPKADGLRAMREASRGHLQARIVEEKSSDVMAAVAPKKLIPFAGKDHGGGIPFSKNPKEKKR